MASHSPCHRKHCHTLPYKQQSHTSSHVLQSLPRTAIQTAMQVQAVAGETCTLEEVTTLDRLPQQLATYTIHTSSRVVHSPGRPKNSNSCVSSEPLRLGPGACVSLVTQPGVVVPPQESRSEAFQCSCDPSAYPWPSKRCTSVESINPVLKRVSAYKIEGR